MSEWTSVEHALSYLSRADSIPHRTEGEAALVEQLPQKVRRVLDLGTGDWRLLALVMLARPGCVGVALDFSPTMLEKAQTRFAGDGEVQVVKHDLEKPLPALGLFDAVVSCFAIHHLEDDRKRELYTEILACSNPASSSSTSRARLLAHAAPARALPCRFGSRCRRGGSIEPSPRRGDATPLVARDRIRGRRLLLEVARDGAPRRGEAKIVTVSFLSAGRRRANEAPGTFLRSLRGFSR